MAIRFRGVDPAECAKIYRPDHIGGIHIPSAVSKSSIGAIMRELHRLDSEGVFHVVDRSTGNVREISATVMTGTSVSAHETRRFIPLGQLPVISELGAAYAAGVYNMIAETVGFPAMPSINTISLRKYPKSRGVLTYHRDYSIDINLIGILSVRGSAEFSIASTRDGKNAQRFTVNPSDLVLLYAPPQSGPAVNDRRPFHGVSIPEDNRFCITFRNRQEKG